MSAPDDIEQWVLAIALASSHEAGPPGQMQQLLDVAEGESERLGTLDESHQPHRVGAIRAIPGWAPPEFG
jgi:hypothetical protein